MYIDIGVKDKAEAEKYVPPGQTGVFASGFTAFGNHKIKSKALDDRVGCAILLGMINSELEYDAVFAFTVKEEVGLVGAAAAAFGVDPDYAIVLETTTAADVAGVSGEKRVCVLGEGAAVSFMDRTTIYSPGLFKRAFEIAEEKGIKAQPKTVVAGGNDAGAIHRSRTGVRTITINTPCRYIHSPSCVADTRDIGEVRRLAEACLYDFCK
jgi:endoglucanase